MIRKSPYVFLAAFIHASSVGAIWLLTHIQWVPSDDLQIDVDVSPSAPILVVRPEREKDPVRFDAPYPRRQVPEVEDPVEEFLPVGQRIRFCEHEPTDNKRLDIGQVPKHPERVGAPLRGREYYAMLSHFVNACEDAVHAFLQIVAYEVNGLHSSAPATVISSSSVSSCFSAMFALAIHRPTRLRISGLNPSIREGHGRCNGGSGSVDSF